MRERNGGFGEEGSGDGGVARRMLNLRKSCILYLYINNVYRNFIAQEERGKIELAHMAAVIALPSHRYASLVIGFSFYIYFVVSHAKNK